MAISSQVDTAGETAAKDKQISVRSYIAEQRVHIAVVIGFALYPIFYSIVVSLPGVGTVIDVFLPQVDTMVAVLYIGLFAISFDFISGYTGYLSFGHALFYGIGAYFVLMAATGLVPVIGEGTPFLLLMLIGAVLAMIVAAVIGLVSFRLTGVYFAMLTLGFAEIAHVLIRNWDYLGTAPEAGIQYGPGFSILDINIGTLVGDSFHDILGPTFAMSESVARSSVSYWIIGIIVIVSYFVLQRIIHSPFGKVMIAIRENEERAKAVGYNTFWYKIAGFSISAFFASIAGALFAAYNRSAAPEETFDLFVTADALLATIIGGFGTLAGGIYGHLFHESLDGILSTESHGLPRYLQNTLPESALDAGIGGVTVNDVILNLLAGRAELYLGIIFIAFVLFVPNGILGTIRDRVGGKAAEHLPGYIRVWLANTKERLKRYTKNNNQ